MPCLRFSLYDYRALLARTAELKRLMDPHTGDLFDLMFRLRAGLGRQEFGLLHEGLYSKAKAGTKDAIVEYLDAVTQALRLISTAR